MAGTLRPPVRIELREGGVLHVVLDRPERRNALDEQTFTLLREAFGQRALAGDVRCVVLRGEGPSFCAGLDREVLATLGGRAAPEVLAAGERLQGVFDTIEACPRPTVASVQGACVGGGAALLLACDLRVAAADAVVAFMEMRYAFLPDLGHIHRLLRDVSLARAREALLFGERITAPVLERWGVLNEVVPLAELAGATARWAGRCAAAPPLAVAELKRLLGDDPAGADGRASQAAALRANAERLLPSGDFQEGLAAALERRPPRFRGA